MLVHDANEPAVFCRQFAVPVIIKCPAVVKCQFNAGRKYRFCDFVHTHLTIRSSRARFAVSSRFHSPDAGRLNSGVRGQTWIRRYGTFSMTEALSALMALYRATFLYTFLSAIFAIASPVTARALSCIFQVARTACSSRTTSQPPQIWQQSSPPSRRSSARSRVILLRLAA